MTERGKEAPNPAATTQNTQLDVAVVLLAAGLSRRMGARNKLLINIEGEPLVRRVARTYLATGAQVHVVLGHEAERVRAALDDLTLTFIENPHFADGQASSVRVGIDSLSGNHDVVLVALADQIALNAEDISNLLEAFAKGDRGCILVPYYEEQRGNPVAFPGKLIAEMAAGGHHAACREFIDNNPQLMRRYEAANAHFVTDIDTPEDLVAFGDAI